MQTVILDALIPREDFEIISDIGNGGNTRNKTTLSIEDLKYDSFFFTALRKPIFQREMNEWDSQKICSMIESFVEGELIPAIILWRNQSGYIFVIDGAHRLSSLGAWINDDYGDGLISRKYYENCLSEEQRRIAEKTRKAVNEKVGSFHEILDICRNPEMTNDEHKKKIAKNLGALAIQLQWVEGNADKAEDSFLKINQLATKISNAELELIRNRNYAYAIAARAIARAGKGYNYWSEFDEEIQKKIIEESGAINYLMFGVGHGSADDINNLPIGGSQASTFTLDVVTQTVKICNGIEKEKEAGVASQDEVLVCLENTLRILQYINSKEKFSLGLHPFIYFYSDIGKHKIGSYYGILQFVKYLIENNKLKDFIEIRARFEQIIYQYNFLVQQIIRKYRQSKRAYTIIKDYYILLMNLLRDHPNDAVETIISYIKKDNDFRFLQTEIVDNEEVAVKSNFSRGRKQQIKIRTFVSVLPKCPICGGYLDNRSISVDHIIRKADGGSNALENGQVTHLYCNTTYKN
jgi:hypothetical protein